MSDVFPQQKENPGFIVYDVWWAPNWTPLNPVEIRKIKASRRKQNIMP
jgi:hypothetical protein